MSTRGNTPPAFEKQIGKKIYDNGEWLQVFSYTENLYMLQFPVSTGSCMQKAFLDLNKNEFIFYVDPMFYKGNCTHPLETTPFLMCIAVTIDNKPII
jgi:hypothetical protein